MTGRKSIQFFETLPWADRTRVNFANVRGAQFLQPLFEFSGACAGCGEAPYLKMLSQLFGDRLQIANATGCSSIYGGNLPTTPWAKERRRPGAGVVELAVRGQRGVRHSVIGSRSTSRPNSLTRSRPEAGAADRRGSGACAARGAAGHGVGLPLQRERVADLKAKLAADRRRRCTPTFWRLPTSSCGARSGSWAATAGPMTSVMAASITCSPPAATSTSWFSTPRCTPIPAARRRRRHRSGASAKFAAAGKRAPRKDLALMAIAYGNVYVAQIAMGANSEQTLIAMREAEALHRAVV